MALQMRRMYKNQEILKLEKYLTFRSHQGIVGNMMRLSEELLRVTTGLPGNIFEIDYSKFQYLASPSFIKLIWYFISNFKIKLEMATPALEKTKVDDLFLMKEFVIKGYSKQKLQVINACRKVLQISLLGEITNGNGSIIMRHIIN